MRLLFVVQRYGHEVFGGAEYFTRELATRLAARGHQVEVVTSCAVSYVHWANEYDEGTSELDGVVVHRLPVSVERDDATFNPLHRRTITGPKPNPYYLQRQWMHVQGPLLLGLAPWLAENAVRFDVAIFTTYLYFSTWAGLPTAARSIPTVLHPTAHDESPLYLPMFQFLFRHPTAFGFLVEEEEELVRRLFRVRRPSIVSGIGVDLEPLVGDEAAFRRAHGLGDDPYILSVGRLDPHKGSVELVDYFAAYKRRNPGDLRLVVVGERVRPVGDHDDVILTGFVDEATKHAAMAGCVAFVQPSFFESFSMVLTEAWAHRRAALVQGHCDVLVGQARRSGGAIPYRGFAEFEEALSLLLADPGLRTRLGEAGRRYVERRYRWDVVLSRYERFLLDVADARPRPPLPVTVDGSAPK